MTQDNLYAKAGVDIDAGNRLVDRIKPLASATRRAGTDSQLGGFGGLFDLKAAGWHDPLLVAATDGVGTKLDLAVAMGKHDTIGIDLVAMCVNDLVVQGAEPLFFLDYFATGKLDVDQAADVVTGIAEACRQIGCALLGGETAEMPGLYEPGRYDLAGFAVGAVKRAALLPSQNMAAGDVILGLASSGIHSNGLSLVRKIVSDQGLEWDQPAPFDRTTSLGAALLIPTRLYVRSLLAAHKSGLIKGLAHITGGGLLENIPRVLPDGLCAEIDLSSWTMPPLFDWLRQAGSVPLYDLYRTFNCGIGMIAIVAQSKAEDAVASLEGRGETVTRIGTLTAETGPKARLLGHGVMLTYPPDGPAS